MSDRVTALRGRASLRRVEWLLVIALPAILAACGKGGASGY
jgi:hypothetical protein